MLHFPPLKIAAIVITFLLAVMFALPNLFNKATLDQFPGFLPTNQVALGLDLRGGAHLLLSMDTEELRKDWMLTLRRDARKQLRDAKIAVAGAGVTNNGVVIRLRDPAQADAAITALQSMVEQVGNVMIGNTGANIEITKGEPGRVIVRPTAFGEDQRTRGALQAALETVRRRIDGLGTSEPLIVPQGRDRILVQVPGFDDTTRLKDLIGKVAKLSFHEVNSIVPQSERDTVRIPPEFSIYEPAPRASGGDGDNVFYILRDEPIVPGDDLVDANPAVDETGRSVIQFRFNQRGARAFGDFTRRHVRDPFAIVIDGKVLSAPVIQSAILGGSGQIFGNFNPDSANDFAVQLKSGALPADLTVIEERTVGPSLGADSVASGTNAGIIGGLAVIAAMIVIYGTFGFFAVLALLVNGIMLIAIMSAVGSTLTLPGIAGLVLTLGMAVDGNVLIYERIREELRSGKPPVTALDQGFRRAFGTIADSQLTTLAAAIIMFWLGAGPIRGFAVTLSIGIFTSMFTAILITRLLVAIWFRSERSRTSKVEVPI